LALLVEVKSALPDARTFRVQREGVCRGEFDFLWQSRSIHLCDRAEERATVPMPALGDFADATTPLRGDDHRPIGKTHQDVE
jgi:hypothetical protein